MRAMSRAARVVPAAGSLFALAALTAGLLAAPPGSDDPTANPEYVHPRIQRFGRVVALPSAAEPPTAGAPIVIDIASGETGPDQVLEGLEHAARLVNLYALEEVTSPQLTVVLHGQATRAVLSHEAHAERTGRAKNPDLVLIEVLEKAGAEVLVCGQALARCGFATTEVAPEVTVALSAESVVVNHQIQGAAYLPYR